VRDNWRKELADAGRFDPARAQQLLWPIARVNELACHSQAVWFVASHAPHPALASVQGLATVYADREVVVLRAPARRC
jgi:hypothetical protein